jgi:plasmid stabilization system protein ParE
LSYHVRFAPAATEDLERLYEFLLEHDFDAAERALEAIHRSFDLLRDFPFTCRKASENAFLRELIIPFGSGGYVA